MPDVSIGKDWLKIFIPAQALLTVSLASVTFRSISFGLLCKKSDGQGERHCRTSFYEEYIELF